MPFFNKKSKKRSKSVLKRRGSSAERIIFWARRFGVVIGIVVFSGWLLSWFFLSGAADRLKEWGTEKVVLATAESGFTVENILLEGRHYTDGKLIKALLNVEKNDPLLGVDVVAAQKTIEGLAWVQTARIERRLPDTLYIKLTERVPMALSQHKGKLSLVDMDGEVITSKNLSSFKAFPLIVGDNAPQQAPKLLSFLKADPAIMDKIEASTLVSDRRWNLKLKNSVVVKLPEDNLELALRRLITAQEEGNLMDKNIREIDMRDTARIIVRTLPGAVQEYKAGYNASGENKI